jgi:GGDEF domain-containing protein
MCVIHLHVQSGSEEARRSFTVGLCQELRSSDLIASDGKNEFRILLTTPDAEKVDALVERIRQLSSMLASADHGGASLPYQNTPRSGSRDSRMHDNETCHYGNAPLVLTLEVERPNFVAQKKEGPCDPCDENDLQRLRRRGA